MNIRTKLVSLSMLTVLLCACGMVAVLLTMTTTSFLAVEKDLARKDITRVVNALKKEFDALEILVHDWAFWDDTWTFIHDQNPGFVASNLNQETLENLHLACIVIYDHTGSRIFSQNHETDTLPFDTTFPATVPPDKFGELQTKWTGTLRVDSNLLLSKASPVTTSDQSMPGNGMLIMARSLDTELLDPLAIQSGVIFESILPDREKKVLRRLMWNS